MPLKGSCPIYEKLLGSGATPQQLSIHMRHCAKCQQLEKELAKHFLTLANYK